MMDEKTKIKQEKLIELVSSFCDENLDEEFKGLCVKLVEKMGRKHDIPFRRGKLEIWASSVVYAIAQINFLFDKSSDLYISPDIICDYFNTKKSTVSNKAKTIRDMFDMGHFDEIFSAKHVLEDAPKSYMDLNSGFIIPADYVDDPMDDFFDEAYELYSEGKVDEALKMLDTIPKNDSEYPRAMFYKSLMREFDDEDSLIDFVDNMMSFTQDTEFIEIDPNDDESVYMQALNLAEIDEFDEALSFIDKAIELNPDNDMYWNDRGNFLTRLERYAEAYVSFDKAIKINPDDSIIWANKGFTYLEDEKEDEALKCYDKAMELAPGEVHPVIGKVKAYFALGDLENAKKFLDIAREFDDEDFEYLSEQGNYYLFTDNCEEAIKYFDKCLERDDDFGRIWLSKALALMQLGDEKNAEKCIEKVSEINPMLLMSLEDIFDD